MTPTEFFFPFMIRVDFLMIRVDPSPALFYFYFFIRSELIRPGLAVRVDPVRLMWYNGRRAKQPGLMRAPGVARIFQRKI